MSYIVKNIIYQSNNSLKVAPDLDCFDYEYDDGDNPSLNDDLDNTLDKTKAFEETHYLNGGLYNTVKQYPTSTTSDSSSKKGDKEVIILAYSVSILYLCIICRIA